MDTRSWAMGKTAPFKIAFGSMLLMLTVTGFGQMPIFKRYYVADIPGLEWLAKFFVTHYIHYLAAIGFLFVVFYAAADHFLTKRKTKRLSASGVVRATALGGIVVTGALLVVRNLSGVNIPAGVIIFLDLTHLGLVLFYLISAAVCFALKKRWTISR